MGANKVRELVLLETNKQKFARSTKKIDFANNELSFKTWRGDHRQKADPDQEGERFTFRGHTRIKKNRI